MTPRFHPLRLFGRPASRPLRRRLRGWRLSIEPLEERLAPDASLPPDLVAGRTLSAYSTADVVNHTLTVTYTVYNQRADDLAGALLTDTLQPGVAFSTATQLPDRDGQHLAWSLGTIPGYGRASVAVTVTLPTPMPLQIDTGAKAFGTVNGGAVSADTPAATLTTHVLPTAQLASTPDANTTDPFVQEQAAKLRYDPAAIFDYLNTQVGYESYVGSLRGARGTLWSAAGNSLDEASLGVALFRASGVPARYAHGTLSDALSKQLILSMFPATYQTVGYIPAGAQTADPANDPNLLAEARDHYWLQVDTGNGFQNADTSGLSGTAIGAAYTTATDTFTEVADALRHKVEVKLDAEIYSQAAAAFGLGDGLGTTTALDHTFNSVDLVGRPLTVGQFVNQSGTGFIITAKTTTYSPYLVVGDEALTDDQLPEAIRGTDFQEVQTNFPLGSQVLTGYFLHTTLSGPDGPAETYDRALVDRIGYAARQGLAGANVSVDPDGPQAMTPFDLWTMYALPGLDNPAVPSGLGQRVHGLQAELTRLQADPNTDPVRQAALTVNTLTNATRLLGRNLLAQSDFSTGRLAQGERMKVYFDRPRLVVLSSTVTTDGTTAAVRLGVDLRSDAPRTTEPPGQLKGTAKFFNMLRGVLETAGERQIIMSTRPGVSADAINNTQSVLAAAKAQRVPVVVLTPADLNGLDSLLVASADAKARITDALRAGQVVVVPQRPVVIGGAGTTAWYQIDPATGQQIGVTEDGGHQAILEYIAYLAIGTLTGVLVGALTGTITLEVWGKPGLRNLQDGLRNDLAGPIQTAITGGAAVGAAQAQFQGLTLIEVMTISGLAETEAEIAALYAQAETRAVFGIASGGLGITVAALFLGFFGGFNYTILHADPPVPPKLSNLEADQTPLDPDRAVTDTPIVPTRRGGQVAGAAALQSAAVAGPLTLGWSGGGANEFSVATLSAASAVVTDVAGSPVGSGAVALGSPTQVVGEGNASYTVSGTGSLAFYGPAGATLGAAGQWDSYTATVTGSPVLTLSTDGLTLNGRALPAGTYTIRAGSATLTGRGPTSAPNFSGSATVTLTNGTLTLGPGAGGIAVGGSPLNLSSGGTLTSYTGTLSVTADGSPADAFVLSGTASQVMTVSAMPAELSADQNTPAGFEVSVSTSLADTYTVSAEAPPGWTVTVDTSGRVTVTPAAGLQAGAYPVRVVVRSKTNPDLVAQTTVPVTVSATQPGIVFAAQPDPLFTVPYNGVEVPTAFRATVRNLGPAADTYAVTTANLSAGFTLLTSGTRVAVPAGQTGILGLYLQPVVGSTLPAPGTVLTFTVTATSTSDPTITQTQTVTFTMPEVHGVTLTADPVSLSTTPGNGAPVSVTVRAVGNVPETVALSTTAAPGLTVSGFPALVSLAVGQSVTVTGTLTPAADTPLNSTLAAALTATFGPAGSAVTQTVQLPVRVAIPGADAIAAASVAAGQLGRTDLAARLNDLSTPLTTLFQHPTDPVPQSQAVAALNALVPLVTADQDLAQYAAGLTTGRDRIDGATSAADVGNATVALGAVLDQLSTTLQSVAAHGGSVFLDQNQATLFPGVPAAFLVGLQNVGNQPTTVDLSVTGLPAGFTAAFSQTAVTLLPGETLSGGANGVTLSITPTGETLVPAGFTVVATPRDAAGITRSVTGSLTVRAEFVQVASVTVTPPFGNPGTAFAVSARVLNAVNAPQTVTAKFTVKDAAGTTVFTSPDKSVQLTVSASLLTVDLGTVDTAGFARGAYTVSATLTDAAGSPIPGGTGQTTLLVGTPVTATLATAPLTLPQGNGTVTNTLTVGQVAELADAPLVGRVQTTPVSTSLALAGGLTYVGGTNGIDVVDTHDPANPVVVRTFAQDLIVRGGATIVRRAVIGGADYLLAGTTVTTNGNLFTLLVYSLADPRNPQLVSNTTFPYRFITDLLVSGNTVLVPTHGVLISGGITDQFGTVLAIDLGNPASPVLADKLFDTRPAPDGGDTNQDGGVIADARTAYIASTTSTGGTPQTGVGRVLVVDFSTPANLTLLREVDLPGTVRVEAIAVDGNRALVVGSTGGNTPAGLVSNQITLSVLDITDRRNPRLVGTMLVTDAHFTNVGITAVALGGGLFGVGQATVNGSPVFLLVDANNPAGVRVGSTPAPAVVNEMGVAGNLLYTTSEAGLSLYTLPVPAAPFTLAGQVATTAVSSTLVIRGTLAYVAGSNGVDIVDVTDPAAPVKLSTFAADLIVQGGYTVVRELPGDRIVVASTTNFNANGTRALVYSLADPLNPALMSNTVIPEAFMTDFLVSGSRGLLTTNGVFLFGNNDAGDPFDQFGDVTAIDFGATGGPAVTGRLFGTRNPPFTGSNGEYGGEFVTPTLAYVTGTTLAGGDFLNGTGRLLVVDTTDPANLALANTVLIPGTVTLSEVAVDGNRALVVGSSKGGQDPYNNVDADPSNDSGSLGNLTLTTLDVTDPANPVVLSTVVTAATFPRGNQPSAKLAVVPVGGGRFAVSNGIVGGQPVLFLVDASDPRDIVTAALPVHSVVSEMTLRNGQLYTTSADGLLIYNVGQVATIPVTATVRVPTGTGVAVVASSFNIPPTRTEPGAGFDTLVFERRLAYGLTAETITWQETVADLKAGESRDVTLGGTVAFTAQGTPGTFDLAGTTVTAAPVVGLSPPAQTTRPGSAATFTVTLANPTAAAVTYTLGVVGVPAGWVGLPAAVTVPANGTQTATLTLTPAAFTALADYGFAVTVRGSNGATGSAQGTLTVAGAPVLPDPDAHGVVVGLTPGTATAGQGTATKVVVRVTNTGSATETFTLAADGLPDTVAAAFSQASVTVPPGAGNFREVLLVLTPAAGTDPGGFPFTVTATAGETAGTAAGALTVIANGVTVQLDRATAAPGDTLMATVTNTGTVADTFNLTTAGPAGLVATLGQTSVSLAPGQSMTVPVTAGAMPFSVQGSVPLTVAARSQGNPAAQGADTAGVQVPPTVGLTAGFDPATQTLPAPGGTDFVLTVRNTGNTEDAYTATITSVTGPVTAYLVGLDGQPTRAIPTFRLPGLSTGAIVVHINLPSAGLGTVTVTIRSQTDPTRTTTSTATVQTAGVSPPVSPPPPASPPPPPVRLPQPALVGGSPDGTAIILSPDAGGFTLGAGIQFFPGFAGDVRVATGDVTGDGVADYIGGAGPGGGPRVVVLDGKTGLRLADFFAFEDTFTGGVNVSAGDLDGDGVADVIVTPDLGGGPLVVVYSGARLAAGLGAEAAQVVRMFGIEDREFRGGARAAAADVDGDGKADLVVSAGFPGGPRIALFRGADLAVGSQTPGRLVPDFFAFEDTFRNGAFVAAGDVNGDGFADLIFGGGPSGGPRVRVASGKELLSVSSLRTLDDAAAADPRLQLANFFVGDPSLRGGVRVAVKDADGDGRAELLTGSGDGEAGRVRVYRSATVLAGGDADRELDPFPGVGLPHGAFVG